MMPRKKGPHEVDVHVGRRIRVRRMMMSVSQEKLGDAVGLTFQQVQKYEKGTNRVSASRLLQFAEFLKVPVSFFFDGAPGQTVKGADAGVSTINQFLATPGGADLAKDFVTLDRPLRTDIVALVHQIAKVAKTGHLRAAAS